MVKAKSGIVPWMLKLWDMHVKREVIQKQVMWDDETYRTELEAIAAALDGIVDELSIRGDGAAQFIFAAANGRAVELSRSDDGVWVEFWNANEDSPHHDTIYNSYALAIRDVSQWLTAITNS